MNVRIKTTNTIFGSNEVEPPTTPRAKALSSTSWEVNEDDGGDDSDNEQEGEFPNVWLTAKVWKEKSGWAGKFKKKTSQLLPLGHYHDEGNDEDDEGALWVRRQIVLDGHYLMYYHARAEILHDADNLELGEFSGIVPEADASRTESLGRNTPRAATSSSFDVSVSQGPSTVHSRKESMMTVIQGVWNHWEDTVRQHQQRLGLTKSPSSPLTPVSSHLQRRETALHHQDTKVLSALNTPRGVLDFHSSDVSVSIAPHSHSSSSFISPTLFDISAPPTPFCLVIKGNKKDLKWKFCFDSRDEMFKWLTVLSDIVVNKNVRGFNKQHGIHKYPEIINEPVSYNPLEKAVAEQLRPPLNSFDNTPSNSYSEPSPSVLDEELAPNRRTYRSLSSSVQQDQEGTVPPRPTLLRSTSGLKPSNGPSTNNNVNNNNNNTSPKSWVLVGSDLYKTILIINGAILYAFLVGASAGILFIFHIVGCAIFANSGLFLFLQRYNGYHSAQGGQHAGVVSYLRQKGNMLLRYTSRRLFPDRPGNHPIDTSNNNPFLTESTPLILTRGTSIRDKLTSSRSISVPHDFLSSASTRSISMNSHLTIPVSNVDALNDAPNINIPLLDCPSKKNIYDLASNRSINASLLDDAEDDAFDPSLYLLSSNRTNKPVAGSSTCQTTLPDTIPPNNSTEIIDDRTSISWYASPSTTIDVRGPDYMNTKKKIPCSHSLYKLVAVDFFESNECIHPITPKVQLQSDTLFNNLSSLETPIMWKSPDCFVISVALPTSTRDTRGYILVGYYQLRDETRAILEMISRPNYNPASDDEVLVKSNHSYQDLINGVKLWERWCKEAPANPDMQSRFKFLARGDNLKEIGVMKWILNYNGKPILIKRAGQTGFLYDNLSSVAPEKNGKISKSTSIMEFHLNLHAFPFLCRQAIVLLKDYYFAKMLATLAFTIEGRSEDELPEVLIGDGMQVHYPDPQLIHPLI